MLLGTTLKAVVHQRGKRGIPPCAKQAAAGRLKRAASSRLRKPGGHFGAYSAEEDKQLGTMPDVELARLLGRTHKAVEARRIQLGIPKYDPKLHLWTSEEDALLGTMADSALAAQMGLSYRAVAHRRRRLGISVRLAHRRPWTPEEDALLGTAGDTEIAARLGRHLATVCIRRQKLGIPNFYRQGRCGRPRQRRSGSASPTEVAPQVRAGKANGSSAKRPQPNANTPLL